MRINCPNCGAPITGPRCEYCGTQHYDHEAGTGGVAVYYADDKPYFTQVIPSNNSVDIMLLSTAYSLDEIRRSTESQIYVRLKTQMANEQQSQYILNTLERMTVEQPKRKFIDIFKWRSK